MLLLAACGGGEGADEETEEATTEAGATDGGEATEEASADESPSAETAEFTPMTEGVLTVGTELPAAPFWIGDDYASIEGGYEYDLAVEIANRLGLDEGMSALLERIGLWNRRDDYPDRLSGGQQQRVAIVRALAMRPKVLLLDEVTSALDPELVAEVLEIIRELAAEGMTMLIATHEMPFARDVAERVCFLSDGQILEQGPPDLMFSTPQRDRTAAFLKRVIAAGRL